MKPFTKTRVRVTQKDIDNGKKKDCSNCPIALALYRQFKFVHVVYATKYCIQLNDRYFRFTLPAKQFIIDFDTDKQVKPFSFTITKL